MSTDRRHFLAAAGAVLILPQFALAADDPLPAEELELELVFPLDRPVQHVNNPVKMGHLFSFLIPAGGGGFHIASGAVHSAPEGQYALELGLYTIKGDEVSLKLTMGEDPLLLAPHVAYSPRTPVGDIVRMRLRPKPKTGL